jgi:hypothetical protein
MSRGLQMRSDAFTAQQGQPSIGAQASQLYSQRQLSVEDVRGVAGQAMTQEAGERFRQGIEAQGAEDIRRKGLSELDVQKYNQRLEIVKEKFEKGEIDTEQRDDLIRQIEALRLGVSDFPEPIKPQGDEPEAGAQTPFGKFVGMGWYERADGSLFDPKNGKVIPSGKAAEAKEEGFKLPKIGEPGLHGGVMISDKLERVKETGETINSLTGETVREGKKDGAAKDTSKVTEAEMTRMVRDVEEDLQVQYQRDVRDQKPGAKPPTAEDVYAEVERRKKNIEEVRKRMGQTQEPEAGAAAAVGATPVKVATQAEVDQLPPGATFIWADGKSYTKE